MKLIGFIFFILTSAVQAQEFAWTGLDIYWATKEACQQLPSSVFEKHQAFLDRLNAGYFPSKKYSDLLMNIHQDSRRLVVDRLNVVDLSSGATVVLKEPLFEKALQECYPQSAAARNYFKSSILRADRSGRALGVVVVVGFFRGTGALFAKISQWSQVAGNFLTKLGYGISGFTLTSLLTADSNQDLPLKYSELRQVHVANTLNLQGLEFFDEKSIQEKTDQSLNAIILSNQHRIQQLETQLQMESDPEVKARLQRQLQTAHLILEQAQLSIQR